MMRKSTVICSLLILIIGVSLPVSAHDGSSIVLRSELDTQLAELSQQTTQRATELDEQGVRECQLTQNYLHGQRHRAKLIAEHRVAAYQVMLDQLNQLAIKLESNDQSAVDLRVAIAELSDLAADFSADYGFYQAELLEASNIACNEQTELRATVNRALSALRTAESQAEQIDSYVANDLNPLLSDTEIESGDSDE